MPLTPKEQELARETGVSVDVCLAIKQHAGKPLRRADAMDEMMQARPADAVAVDVADGGEAERVMAALAPVLRPHSCRAFWSERHEPSGVKISDEVVVMTTDDPYAIVRLRQSSAGNYGLSTDDILDRLRAWESLATFTCVGASNDWVALAFASLPPDVCAFAVEVYSFCPDSVEQGVGLQDEADDPEKFEAARRLCPQIPPLPRDEDAEEIAAMGEYIPENLRKMLEQAKALEAAGAFTPSDMGVRLLAEEIHRTRYLFLWWD